MSCFYENTCDDIEMLSKCDNVKNIVYRTMCEDEKMGVHVSIPCFITEPSFYDTVEGCTLSWCDQQIVDAVRSTFNELPSELKYKLAFVPESGEFIDRAYFWKELLRTILPPVQYKEAVGRILHWYIHIKRMELIGE